MLRSLSAVIRDWTPEHLDPAELARIASIDPQSLCVVDGKPRLGVPIVGVRNFIAIGLNYTDHAAETNLPIPSEPVIFMKATSCLSGPNDDLMLPKASTKTDWEVELGVVLGRTARYVEEAQALDCVAGYCLVHDVSEREYQIERGGTWDKGKGCDTFGPVGPWLITPDEFGDPQRIGLWLEVNGMRRQSGNTRTMIFRVAQLIAYVSRFMTLRPGDILTTGTPPGVGMGMKPMPIYLKAGDVVRLGGDGLGVQEQRVIAWKN
jgi:2-keto-4-pentenoate hydratase/2-oxohepta-3-ene-1,7-dioic acid hydratase in catechol pathway